MDLAEFQQTTSDIVYFAVYFEKIKILLTPTFYFCEGMLNFELDKRNLKNCVERKKQFNLFQMCLSTI